MTNRRTKSSTKEDSRGLWVPNSSQFRQKWVCLWQDEEGLYIVNQHGEYLCAESWTPGDEKIESAMHSAAKSYGVEGGKAVWIKGRKVSAMEADDQMERLLEGKVPDEQEETLIALDDSFREKHGLS